MVSPSYVLIVSCVLIAVFLTAHPMIGIVIGGMIALVIIAAMRERWHGRPF